MNSKELSNAIKNNQIKFSEVKNKQNEFLNKLSNIKIGKNTKEQKEKINNLEKFYNSREEVTYFKILTLKQIHQRLPITLAQVKAGNNSLISLLNEKKSEKLFILCINQNITKKVYNNIIKSMNV